MEASIIREIARLAERKDVISAMVADFVARNRNTVPELEHKRQGILHDLAAVGSEKQKLSQWLLGTGLTPQAVAFINAQIDALCEKETRLQEQQWGIEDRLAEFQTRTHNARAIGDQLKEFVRTFPDLDHGEKKLWLESLVDWVEVGHNERVTALLRPPLRFGSLTTSPAPRGRKPEVPELRILVEYDLGASRGADRHADAAACVDPRSSHSMPSSLVHEAAAVAEP